MCHLVVVSLNLTEREIDHIDEDLDLSRVDIWVSLQVSELLVSL